MSIVVVVCSSFIMDAKVSDCMFVKGLLRSRCIDEGVMRTVGYAPHVHEEEEGLQMLEMSLYEYM